ncbi:MULTISPECIES: hypothetical protein [Geobacter]|uniref:Uncharacterized protein n=2 Tax=Geobacter TaxID=28231 RepID=A0A0C1TQG6_9BACT|nr:MULTISPECIES: hypothetical protein [Geobacter]ANA39724.1 hypothetical protein A2G06_04400 [Geobacter anodireducens]KIE41513.1 hypothetical protein SE37_02140 [Geobacter soli]MBE2888112.1 hypothetical protein [Geobacter anodireducens]
MPEFYDVPSDMDVHESILSKETKNGFLVDVRMVKRHRQYEAALFLNGRYKPGPPLPRPLDNPSGDTTHWMGVRPSVGFTDEEAQTILDDVKSQNDLHHITFRDTWGREYGD